MFQEFIKAEPLDAMRTPVRQRAMVTCTYLVYPSSGGSRGRAPPRSLAPRPRLGLVAELCAGSQHGHAQQPGSCGRQLSTAFGLGSAGLCSARSAAQSQGHRALRCAKLTSAPRLKILKHVTALTQIQRAPCLPLTKAGGTEHGAWSAGIHVKTPGAALPPLQRSVPFLNLRSSVLEPHLSDPDRTELIDTCLASVLALPPDPGPERDGISSDALHKEVRVGHGGCPAGVAQRGGAALFAPSAAPAAFTAPCPPSGCSPAVGKAACNSAGHLGGSELHHFLCSVIS